MKSKKELTQEIDLLKKDLEYERGLNRAIKEATENGFLPPKGAECTGCEHCIIYLCNSRAFVIGCKKDVSCKDFKQSKNTVLSLCGYSYGKSRFVVDAKEILMKDHYVH